MAEDLQGFEAARNPVSPWCWTCGDFVQWPGYGQCSGCLTRGRKPQDTVTFRTVHWDTAVLHAVIRRKVAQWEQACPGWQLVPDMQRYWEDSTHPSKYVDRETTIGRKLAWTRFRVVRTHPRGVRRIRLTAEQLQRVYAGTEVLAYPPETMLVMPVRALEEQLQQMTEGIHALGRGLVRSRQA